MADRFAVPGNPAPGSNPEPGVPGAAFSTNNPMSGGGAWAPMAVELSENGEFAAPGNPPEGSEPENGPVMSQAQPMCGGGWEPERFAAPGNPAPGSDPCC